MPASVWRPAPALSPRVGAAPHRNARVSPKTGHTWRARSGTAIRRSPKPTAGTTRYGSGCPAPTGSWPILRDPRCLLDAANRSLHQVPHQRHFVAVVLQGLDSLYRQLSGHFGGGLVARLTTYGVFHLFQAHRVRG